MSDLAAAPLSRLRLLDARAVSMISMFVIIIIIIMIRIIISSSSSSVMISSSSSMIIIVSLTHRQPHVTVTGGRAFAWVPGRCNNYENKNLLCVENWF